MAMRTRTVAGNWKMHLDREGAVQLARAIRNRARARVDGRVAICPPYPFLDAVVRATEGSAVLVGAQDVDPEPSGARTGAVSAEMVRSVGATFTLVGHSERRALFGDDDAIVGAKLRAARRAGLDVTLCCGETLAEREAHRTLEVVRDQLAGALDGVGASEMAHVTIAYEPVWAIGTGRVATPAQAQEVHAAIRAWLSERFDAGVAAAALIQYGGSVKPANAAELLACPDIDGALVGGASLDADAFIAIVRAP